MNLIDRHLSHARIAGLRPRTILSRGQILNAFQRTVTDRDLLRATRLDVELFLGRDLALQSRVTYLNHLRSFYRWAIDSELLDTDPTGKIRMPRVPHGVPRPITSADLAVALRHATPVMRAWLLLMALGGLRCLEVAALRPADILTVDGVTLLYLRECKGGGTATIPAHDAILEALSVLPIYDQCWWLHTPNTISAKISTHLHSLGINGTAHQLRHSAITAWYRVSEHDVLTTAELSRHRSLNNVRIYAQIDPTRSAQVVGLVKVPR